ncbi:MAG: flavodoxin-dependent (E)-4-hydroxy-3-methylbut-2-enyl-diphosphate synthase, partial [Chloroflexi bacterium]|nr:flavodoxin-dependent (E)-4-hydroxy-3-methylbut-2-enyl-diphosphate synthase [Chloroflexota bacterium]
RAGLRRFFLSLRLDDLGDVVRGYRLLSAELAERGRRLPLLLRYRAEGEAEAGLLQTSTCLGSLLCDGMGDLVEVAGERPAEERTRLAFNVLQAASVRFSKAEFVACPSCGRTLFDLQPVTDRIKAKTGHLTGVKIAIMGCVVNGPGEMADAHFGYVGGGPGRVNLYVGKQVIEKNIPSEVADERLIDLIKSHGKWTEPPAPGE